MDSELQRGKLLVAWDWVTTIPTLILFAIVFVVADVTLRIAVLFGDKAIERAAGAMQRILIWAFFPSGLRLSIDRHPAVKKSTGYIFVSNHQSFFDVPIIGGILFSNFPKYVAKEELGRRFPFVSFNLRRGGSVLIDRGAGREAIRKIRDFARICQERGVSAVIFPEGSRSRNGALKPFKPVGSMQLIKAAPELEVVPITIDGSWRLLTNRLFPIPFGTKVRIKFGEPIARQANEKTDEIVESVREVIAETLDGWRAEPAL